MRPLYVFLLTIVIGQCAMAQMPEKKPSNGRYSSRYNNATWFAKVNIAGLLDPETPTFQPSLEYRINKRIAVELTLGLPVYTFRESRPTDTTYYRYYKIKAGLKFYPGKEPRFYVMPEFFFTHRERSKYDGVVKGKDGNDYEYRYAELEKSIIGLVMKFGIVAPISEKINLEPAIGFGPRYVYLKLNATNL